MATDWHQGQYEAVHHRGGEPSARGRLASICSYGNLYENACDIVDDLLSPANWDLLLAAMGEADRGEKSVGEKDRTIDAAVSRVFARFERNTWREQALRDVVKVVLEGEGGDDGH